MDVVNELHRLGKRVLYITNNSTKTREQYLEKLSGMGFSATKDDIFGTAYTSALYLKNEIKVRNLLLCALWCNVRKMLSILYCCESHLLYGLVLLAISLFSVTE